MTIVVILIGAFAVSWLLDAAYRYYWRQQLDARVEFQKEPAVEGQEAELTETIYNRKWMFLPVLQVGFQIHRNLWFADGENTSVSDQCYKRDIFAVGGYQKITRTIPFRCTKRGYYELDKVELITRSPLMTRKYYATLSHPGAFYVFPKQVDDQHLEIPFQRLMGSVLARRYLYEDPFEFAGIREYVPADPTHKINWKASARTDQWMVNQFSSTTSQEVVILLDVEDETIWKYDGIHEEGIRLAASLISRCVQRGIPVGFRTNGKDQKLDQLFSMEVGSGQQQVRTANEGLARLDLGKQAEAMEILLTRERERAAGVSRTYVMISKNQKESCWEGFEELMEQGAGGLWIATLYRDMEWKLKPSRKVEVLRWEVEK